jgi:hypothetical protein
MRRTPGTLADAAEEDQIGATQEHLRFESLVFEDLLGASPTPKADDAGDIRIKPTMQSGDFANRSAVPETSPCAVADEIL